MVSLSSGLLAVNSTTLPPLAAQRRPSCIASIDPGPTITTSAISPLVYSRSMSSTFPSPGFSARSAPSSTAFSHRYGTKSVPTIVRAPACFASATCNWPIIPSPITKTLSPGRKPERRMDLTAQAVGSIKEPSANDISSGRRKVSPDRLSLGTTKYSAIPPGTIFVARHVRHCTNSPR